MHFYLVNTVLATEADGTVVCHDQTEPEFINALTPELIAATIREYFDERGSIHISAATINDWFGELEYVEYSSITVGILPFDVSYYNACDPSEIDVSRDGVYVDLIYGDESGVAEAAEEIRSKPQEHIYIS